MPIGETIPTIAELKGNTILELFKNGYNALKNVLVKKQNKLVAGSNIVIDETTNRISAIEGGTATLEDYYTKLEVNDIVSELGDEIDTKADSDDVYDKTYVDNLMVDVNGELENKANTADVYDKDETYAKTEVYNKTETYNKSEVDALIDVVAIDGEVVTPAGATTMLYLNTEIQDGDVIVCNIGYGDNAVFNGVITKNSTNSVAQFTTSGDNRYITFMNLKLEYSSFYGKNVITLIESKMLVSNHSITNTQLTLSALRSTVRIFRKVTQ